MSMDWIEPNFAGPSPFLPPEEVRLIDLKKDGRLKTPVDERAGLVMVSPRYLFLSQYAAYVDGKTCESKDMYWSVGLAVHRAEPRHAGLEGQVIDVMVGDLRNPILVDLSEQLAA